jgi:spore germination protein
MITPFTFGFREDGSLIEIDTADIVEASLSIGTNAVFLLSTLEDNNRFNSYLPGKVFANPDTKQALITNVINAAIKGKFRYIDIDFEFLPKEEAENFAAFIKDLKDQANTNGIFVIVALAAKTYAEQPGLLYEGHPYRLLGESADYVLLMTYEWGYTYGPAQAVAPINKVRQVVEYATREIDHNKILLGFPNYGYDWPLPYQSGNMAKSIGNIEAIALARRYNQRILYDSVAQTPYFYYTDSNGTQHAVWFEDARSALAKLNLISEFDLAGLSVWTAMRPFPALWQLTNVLFDIET